MTIFIALTCFLLLLTKYLDCVTTLRRIKSPHQERNRLARTLMLKYGIQKVVWGIMGLTILIVGLSVLLLFTLYNHISFQISFIVLGFLISIIQGSVAYFNYTGSSNYIIRLLSSFNFFR
jgi:hypothetical protein